jgi:urease accessory protein UreE
MALEKQTVTGQIEVGETGTIGLRTDTVVTDDGVELNRSFHRKVLAPGDDVSGEDAKVQAVAAAVWTTEVVAAYAAAQAAAAPAAEESE